MTIITPAYKINKAQSMKLGENLQALLNKNGITESRLASALGIPLMTIRRLLSGETGDPRISTLKIIADYFNVSIDSLIEDNGYKHIEAPKQISNLVPILSWISIENIKCTDEIPNQKPLFWQPIATFDKNNFSKNTFALESRPSLQSRYPLGTILIIDPEALPSDGDIILIKSLKTNELSLRELIIDSPKWQLQPIVIGSEVIFYNEKEYSIIGTVVLTLLFSKKK